MKNKFSKSWKRSKQPRKQRKYRANAPNHHKGKFLSAHLSKDLREKYGIRSLRIRKEDTVKVMRGEKKGKEGKVLRVDTKNQKVYVNGIEVQRRDGSKSQIPFKPSNLMIVSLDKTDRKRMNKLGEEPEKKEESTEEKSSKGKKESSGTKTSSDKKKGKTKSGSKKSSSKKSKKGDDKE